MDLDDVAGGVGEEDLVPVLDRPHAVIGERNVRRGQLLTHLVEVLGAEGEVPGNQRVDSVGAHIKDGHFVDPAGFRDSNAEFHLFPVEATGNATLVEAYRKLLVQEYMGHVLTPSVSLVGDITKDHIDIVAAYERGDIDGLRGLLVEHNEHAKATMRAGIDKTGKSASR
jgi:benzoate/toluate 1,2-dioxygenase reductase component